ncbi:hypothetical protein F4825DRAFT_277535 [Nemania diffusa]|nr:hypothetical protein F4825DRAFT_277535 [Nemania diffusa]
MLLIFTVLLVLFFSTPACVADSVQGDWVFPQEPNYASVVQLNQLYTIQWTPNLAGWFSQYCPDCNTSSVDLWVTSSGNNDAQEYKIASSLDVSTSLSVTWTASIPTSDLSASRTWVFRFVPSGETPSSTSEQISSSIFTIDDPNAASSSSVPSSSSTTSTSTTPASTNSMTTTTTSAAAGTDTMTTATPQPSSELSTGAKAGIGVGAGLGGIALIALGWFLARLPRRGGSNNTPIIGGAETGNLEPEPKPEELYGTSSPQMAYSNPSPPQIYSRPPVEADSLQVYPR